MPCKATFLYGIKVPLKGGDTLYASATRAYEALDVDVQERIAGLSALHAGTNNPNQRCIHPMVVVHPETGRKILYVNRLLTQEVVGLPSKESQSLLRYLFDRLEAEPHIYRHHWTVNDLVMWDNRSVQHARTDFDPAEPRMLRRLTTKGASLRSVVGATA